MAGRSAKGGAGGRKPTRKPRAKTARAATPTAPALGNDPFTRGAATRPVAARALTPGPAPIPARAPPPAAAAAPTPHPTAPHRPSVAEAAAAATAKLAEVERRAEATLGTLERRAGATFDGLERRLHELAGGAGLEHARDELRVVLAKALPALLSRLGAFVDLFRLLEPAERLDRYGMDPRLAERAAPLLELLYSTWWRVEARSLERLPAAGPALVVANHAGAVPWDALVLRHALRRDPVRRELRPLLDDRELALPYFGTFAVRAGAVRSNPENAESLLREGALVGVFPEGHAVARKPWSERYRIQRFGRGGFAKLALRAGVPIVPCAIVGSEEASPAIARPGWLAERLGLSALLSDAAFLRLGPAGLLPLPSKWTIRFGEPIAATGGPAAAEDPAAVLALTEAVRSRVQAALDEEVAGRGSVFL